MYVCHRIRSCDFDVTFLELGIIIDRGPNVICVVQHALIMVKV